MSDTVVYKEESFAIIGACFAAYKEMGCGYLEPAVRRCLDEELTLRKTPFMAQKGLMIRYHGTPLKQFNVADIVCYDQIVLELKAVKDLNDQHRARLGNYLKATRMELGILVNFGHYPQVQYHRFVANDKWAEDRGK